MKTTLILALASVSCLVATGCAAGLSGEGAATPGTLLAKPESGPVTPAVVGPPANPAPAAGEKLGDASQRAFGEALRGCDAGEGARCSEAGIGFLRGAEPNELAARRTFERGCTFGDGRSCLEAALLLGSLGEGEDARRVFLNRGCAFGDAVACTTLGFEYLEHGAVESAARTFARACTLGQKVGCAQADAARAELGEHALSVAEPAPVDAVASAVPMAF